MYKEQNEGRIGIKSSFLLVRFQNRQYSLDGRRPRVVITFSELIYSNAFFQFEKIGGTFLCLKL